MDVQTHFWTSEYISGLSLLDLIVTPNNVSWPVMYLDAQLHNCQEVISGFLVPISQLCSWTSQYISGLVQLHSWHDYIFGRVGNTSRNIARSNMYISGRSRNVLGSAYISGRDRITIYIRMIALKIMIGFKNSVPSNSRIVIMIPT